MKQWEDVSIEIVDIDSDDVIQTSGNETPGVRPGGQSDEIPL